MLIARDYQEVVTYSFVDAEANKAFTGSDSGLILSNPISSEMSVMRASLWPGMVAAAAANVARQQERVRIFEASKSFHGKPGAHTEVVRIAGLVSGPLLPEQWGSKGENADFFDIKADVEALLLLATDAKAIQFRRRGSCRVAVGPGRRNQAQRRSNRCPRQAASESGQALRPETPGLCFRARCRQSLGIGGAQRVTYLQVSGNTPRHRGHRRRRGVGRATGSGRRIVGART